MTTTAIRARARAGEGRSWAPAGFGDVRVRVALGGAMAAAAALGLWLNRHISFSPDEISWFVSSQHLNTRGALLPYGGHLILTTRLVYAASLRLFGASYLPFRLLVVGTVLLTAGLFFAFAKRRVGALAALAPTLVLLLFGSDAEHLLEGNGFTVLLALAAGIGALLALEHDELRGDVAACALLCLAAATYSDGVPFVAGAAVLILLGSDRWRRVWVFLIPAVLYASWLAWSRHLGASTESATHVSNLLLAPDWAFDSLGAAGAALLGLNYDFSPTPGGTGLDASYGPVVAVLALGALAWRLRRARTPRWLWATMALPATLWLLGAAAATPGDRVPDAARYLFPAAVVVLLVAAEAARGVRIGRGPMLVLYGFVAISLATNITILRHQSNALRSRSSEGRVDLAAVEIGDGRVGPHFPNTNYEAALRQTVVQNVAIGYLQAVRKFGSPAFSLPELRAQSDLIRAHADQVLADGLGLQVQPTSAPARDCHRVTVKPAIFLLPPGGSVLRDEGQPAPLMLRRFATAFTVSAGQLNPGTSMALTVPRDSAPDPWYASTAASPLTVCGPPS